MKIRAMDGTIITVPRTKLSKKFECCGYTWQVHRRLVLIDPPTFSEIRWTVTELSTGMAVDDIDETNWQVAWQAAVDYLTAKGAPEVERVVSRAIARHGVLT